MRRLVVRLFDECDVPIEELYYLRKTAFSQWAEDGLDISEVNVPLDRFTRYLKDKTVFVAHDATTGVLLAIHVWKLNSRKRCAIGSNLAVDPYARREGIASQMLQEEIDWLRREGYRFLNGATAIPARWSVRWHLKNGYYIVGYSRNEWNNYASYIFRKQIAIDVKHHPSELLWMRPIAPFTAKMQFAVSYIAIIICKRKSGQLNWLGRVVKKIIRK